ncbi:MAG TPA: DedA family protein [Thermomicrobiales bacterium]|nr:DedA family protein [Thermomicrobiales bacterium]
MSSLLGDFASWATDVIEALGYWGLAFLVALENVFPPIPSEVILPMAGFLTGDGRMNFFLAVFAATVGSVAGALILYGVGYWFGERRVRSIIRRWGKWLGFKESDVDKANGWFDRHGGLAVMLCRVVPIVRSLISIPAGLRKMPIARFILYTALGSLVWNSVLIGAGWILGDNWEEVEQYVGILQYLVIIVALIAAAWWIWNRIIKPRMRTA